MLTLSLLTGCKSDEDKIKDFVNTEVKKTLYYPESYDPVDISVAEYGIDVFSKENIQDAKKIFSLCTQVDKRDEDIENYHKRYGDKFTPYIQGLINGYQRDKDNCNYEINRLIKKYQNGYFEKRNSEDKEKLGYIVTLRFRAKNNSGNVDFSNLFILVNKDKNKIVKMFDMDGEFICLLHLTGVVNALGPDGEPNGRITIKEYLDTIQ